MHLFGSKKTTENSQRLKLGTTYSSRHAAYLDLDQDLALNELTDFGFDIIRLGCYWDEIEPEKGEFNFEEIMRQLEHCELKNQDVVLTIGMKAPRWPEYFFPEWVDFQDKQELLGNVKAFLGRTVEELSHFKCIKYWQVENEPFFASGPNGYALDIEFVREEVALVREVDSSREILITFWGNNLPIASTLYKGVSMADIIGFDIYYQQWKEHLGRYGGPELWNWRLKRVFKKIKKPIWIAELQSEIWEPGDYKENALLSGTRPSASAELLRSNFEKAKRLDPEVILFWGFEYWLLKKLNGEPYLWEEARQIVKHSHTI